MLYRPSLTLTTVFLNSLRDSIFLLYFAYDSYVLGKSDFLIVIPTYNEYESLPILISSLKALTGQYEVLIVDDGSTDGTLEFCLDYASSNEFLQLVNRGSKLGLASAYKLAFEIASKRQFQFVVQMDADGSNRAIDLEKMANEIKNNPSLDLCIGSRWVPGGSILNWPRNRYYLSKSANVFANIALGLKVKDSTAGFRIYKTSSLSKASTSQVLCEGYGFQIEMTNLFRKENFSITEIPIRFVERELGVSKMSKKIIFEAFMRVLQLFIIRLRP